MSAHCSRASSGHWLTAWPRRIPLTLGLIAMITLVALLTGALTTGTPAAMVARWGFSLDNLRQDRLLTIFTSDMMVYNSRHYLDILTTLVAFVAPVEWIAGSGLTAAVYWPGSIGGSLIASGLTALLESVTNWAPHPDMVAAADIGASVATWSAAGALTVLLGLIDKRLVWPVRLGLGSFLLARIIYSVDTSNLAHMISFCLGIGIAHTWLTVRRRTQGAADEAA